ncbi:MAG: flagellar basal body-associated protein FliL [Bacteriovoracaceae bacterium]|jgi:flagellar basal body-associated protein FliL
MIEKFAKLEEFLNKLLGKIFASIFQLLIKAIPKPISDKYLSIKSNLQSWKVTKIELSKKNAKAGYANFKIKVDQLFTKINEIQNYPVKEKGIEKLAAAKYFILTTSPKQHKENFKIFLKPKSEYVFTKIKSMNKKNAIVGLSLFALIIAGGIGMYFGANQIFMKEFPSRSIASVQEYDYKPDYRLYEQKTIKILNMKVPIFSESVEKINSITVDFSLRTSTRFAKYYLIQYEYKLKDYFFTTVEPVVSDFPMQTEGKEVLKEKIRDEINNFLYENHVEGEVEEVNILYMVGS